jgi:hypothetical protein
MITDEDVMEFQELYAAKFGIQIDKDDAYKKLTVLVRQMEIIYQPITTEQYDKYVNEYEVRDESERSGKAC